MDKTNTGTVAESGDYRYGEDTQKRFVFVEATLPNCVTDKL